MLTTHFDLVSGPFWVPGGLKRAIWPCYLNFHAQFCEGHFFVSNIGLLGALLIQHCYSPFVTTQFEKTVENRQKGPVWASKYPFGIACY